MIQVSEHQCPASLLQQNSFCQYIISLIVSCFNSSFQCFIQEGPGVLRPWFETCSEGTKNSNRAAMFDQNTDQLMLRLWLRVANSKSDKIINVGVCWRQVWNMTCCRLPGCCQVERSLDSFLKVLDCCMFLYANATEPDYLYYIFVLVGIEVFWKVFHTSQDLVRFMPCLVNYAFRSVCCFWFLPYPYGPMDCLIVPFQVMPAAKDHRCVCCSLSLMAWSQSLQASGKASSWTCMSCNLFWTSCDYQFVFARKLFSLVFARPMAGQGKMMGIRKILALLILAQMCMLVCPQSSAVQ